MKRLIVIAIATLVVAAGCMKKEPNGTLKTDTTATEKARENAQKSGEELKTDMQKIGEKLKADAEKARKSEAAKRAEEKAGEGLEKAGQKLKQEARH